MGTRFKCGMYGGSFNPLHLGHVSDMLQAANQCDKLIVVLCTNQGEIDPRIRYRWIHQTIGHYPNVQIFILDEKHQDKHDVSEAEWLAGAEKVKQFVGLRNWNKHYDTKANEVEAKKMSVKQLALFLVTSAICVILYKFLLDWIKGTSTLLDSMSTVLSIFACLLMTQRYREQWILWIIIDVITVGMWVIVKDGLMIAMWSIYLVNAIYGLIVWSKSTNKENICTNSKSILCS